MMKAFNQRRGWRLHRASRGLGARIENRERGTTAVEFAICVVLLLTVVFGIMDFSRALYAYHFLSNSAREATRYAIVRGHACDPSVMGSACPAAASDITSYVQNTLAPPSGGLITPNAITVATTWTKCTSCTNNNDPGSTVQVKLSYPFNFILPFLPKTGITMSSTSQMVIAQ